MLAQIQLRQDTEANRTTCTPALGEAFFTIDLEELWMGDGATPGGIYVGSEFSTQAPADQNALAAATVIAVNPSNRFSNLLQRITAIGAGSGAFAITVNLYRAKALPAATVRVNVELPASTNPTVNVYDQTSAVELWSANNSTGNAVYLWADFQLGADGAWHRTASGVT
jgi:hypothetical protein